MSTDEGDEPHYTVADTERGKVVADGNLGDLTDWLEAEERKG